LSLEQAAIWIFLGEGQLFALSVCLLRARHAPCLVSPSLAAPDGENEENCGETCEDQYISNYAVVGVSFIMVIVRLCFIPIINIVCFT